MTRGTRIVAAGVLSVAILLVFAPATGFGFASLDDPAYVSANAHVRHGLTWQGLVWACTTTEQSNYHPLTWLSLQADAELYGTNPGAFHRTNLLLHLCNALLLFFGLGRCTGLWERSALAAALFAIHPLRVESVVWIAERKDVLSTLFLLLALGGYLRYARGPRNVLGFLLVAVPFALGLLAKPMLVSLPLLLLLLDVWPLHRTGEGWKRLVLEKVPLFALSLVSAIITLVAQRAGGALRPFERYPLPVRAANALVSYAAYLREMVWPAKLAVYYPHPHQGLSPLVVVLSALLLALLTLLALRAAPRRPQLAVGWLWYLVSLVPVIGLVQVGGQAMADRYTYVPSIGISVALAWVFSELGTRSRTLLVAGALVALVLLGFKTRAQVLLWQSNVRLFEHTLRVTRDNALAHNCLANALFREQRLEEAIGHYREAIRLSPAYADAHGNLGAALLNQGKLEAAEAECREALRLEPTHVRSTVNLALVQIRRGRLDDAALRLEEALRLDPGQGDAHRYLGAIRAQQGSLERASAELEAALGLDPSDDEARRLLREVQADPRRR